MRRPWTTRAEKKAFYDGRAEKRRLAEESVRRVMAEGGRPLAMIGEVFHGFYPTRLFTEALINLEARIVSLEEKEEA